MRKNTKNAVRLSRVFIVCICIPTAQQRSENGYRRKMFLRCEAERFGDVIETKIERY